MSEALNKIRDYRKKSLIDLYDQLTPVQQDLFNRMYVDVEEIPDDKIDWAIQQCERTISKNKQKITGVI